MKAYIYSFLGNAYVTKGDKQRAIICFEKAINANTKNILAIYNYGLILLQDGAFDKSLQLFLKALNLNEKKINKKSLAPSAINKTIFLEKNIPLAIASSYWKLNQIDKAIETLENLRKKYEYVNPNTLTTLGYFYLLKKDYEKAKEITQLALNDDENFFPAWDNMGQIYLEQKDLTNAKENFLKALSLNKNSVDSLYHLGVISQMQNDNNEALDYFYKAKNCNITTLNTISKEMIEEKINLLKK